jgi:L-lactate dehydrogenase
VHGDSEVAAWNAASIGGVPVDKTLSPEAMADHTEVEQQCREHSQSIVSTKGSTPFGMGSVVASICSSIVLDKRNVKAVSHFQPEFGCCFSLPVVLGREGIVRTVQMPLSDEEKARIAAAAARVKAKMERIRG